MSGTERERFKTQTSGQPRSSVRTQTTNDKCRRSYSSTVSSNKHTPEVTRNPVQLPINPQDHPIEREKVATKLAFARLKVA
ncbi:unnamed protein product [Bursaphelenchus xylophilus]|uniref:(pine wood nematode) hypothetical protein n=1 Tax=Bursaphelenchus xylophilus TaxID=6326 RepID=A0A1I7RJN3_BURXY|nr:unnamed protein product [Bursaphelenchus xylophilus]CAG9128964.1 unnamed protein product [Bursaphelenchus xylophilus]